MKPFSARRPLKQAAFTLVEILVVLAISGILAAILFPAFSSVRANARAATCASNLRQIGLGMLMYAQDHNGLLPKASVLSSEKGPRCGWPDYFQRYARDAQIFQCPDDEQEGIYDPACSATQDKPVHSGAGGYALLGTYNDLKLSEPTILALALDGKGEVSSVGT